MKMKDKWDFTETSPYIEPYRETAKESKGWISLLIGAAVFFLLGILGSFNPSWVISPYGFNLGAMPTDMAIYSTAAASPLWFFCSGVLAYFARQVYKS